MRDRRAPAGRIAYVGGRYVPHAHATVNIEDRGLQFADSIYEGFAVIDGKILDETGHLNRMERSLRELGMPMPMQRSAVAVVLREVVRRNRVTDGFLYLQITRGAARRDHPIPAQSHPTLIVTCRPIDLAGADKRRSDGIVVTFEPDNRWGRCDIKTTSLTANIMAKTSARAKGAYEAWLFDANGNVTEGASTSAWIVTADGCIVTRDLGANILPGVTRASVMRAVSDAGTNAKIEERAFSQEEALAAQEAFITAASAEVMPVIRIDNHTIGDGKPGPVTRRLQSLYRTTALGDVLS